MDPTDPSPHPAIAFVRSFHEDLTRWFAGTDQRASVLGRLRDAVSPEMVLVYPSGTRLTGARFIESIEPLYGSSPGFTASIESPSLIRADTDYALVSYIETQTGARQSATANERSAFALIERDGNRWRWRFIQETAMQ